MQSPITQPTSNTAMSETISVESLKLVVAPSERDDEEDERESEWPWLKTTKYLIILNETQVGHIIVQFIDVSRMEDSFCLLMDGWSHELAEFSAIFDPENGILREMVCRAGTGCWNMDDAWEMLEHPYLYIEEVVVEEAWRGRGIGSWAIPQLFQTEKVKASGSTYLFTWPTVLNRLEPHHLFGPIDTMAYEAKRQRNINFYRKIGFRRLGNSCFFCLAKDVNHPSRRIAPDQDAVYVEPPRKIPRTPADVLEMLFY
ncbi:hypothetical protein BDP27DRAFT_345459 [Rhodocollybia butyracea]|uniref:N-acetyltransferase domain-containing protein n=1 Tax=Rhodocollybia butyracea TaxID=206335 RepID=A0A9P5Q4V7_9AGAR|nr:hypothetical protein BDP27DRAFT_345459 [Rhodocollybia butyracea]